jgi:hypothetical protein
VEVLVAAEAAVVVDLFKQARLARQAKGIVVGMVAL